MRWDSVRWVYGPVCQGVGLLYVAGRGVSWRSSLSLIFMKCQAYIDYHPVEPFAV